MRAFNLLKLPVFVGLAILLLSCGGGGWRGR